MPSESFSKVTAGFEPAITVLQTGALPLGYRTIHKNDSNGNRTRVTAVKGRCLNRLTMEPNHRTANLELHPKTTEQKYVTTNRCVWQ